MAEKPDSATFPFWETTVSAEYGFPAPVSAHLIRRGGDGNETYRIEAAGQRYILRAYGLSGEELRQTDWAEFETHLLAYLQKNAVPVAAAVPRLNGDLLGKVETPDGLRCVVLFTFAEGNVHWPLNQDQSRTLGAALAHLHVVADGFPLPANTDIRTYDAECLLESPLRLMLPYLHQQTEAATYLRSLADQIKAILDAVPQEKGAYGVVHGDIHQGNCHFQEDGSLTFFDFSNCGVGLRAWDFTGFLWPLRDDTILDPVIKASCDAFLEGYESVRPLSAPEKAAIPAFIKVRDYWETGNWLTHDKTVDPAVVRSGLLTLTQQFQAKPL